MLKQILYSAVFLAICGSPIQIFGISPDHNTKTSTYGLFDFFSSKPITSNLQKEIVILKEEIDKLKEQQSEIIAIINSAKSDMISINDEQKRRIDNSNELERILVKYGNTPNHISVLNHAIEAGDANAVILLLENGADVNSGKGSALSTAARHNQIEIAQILLEMSADVNCSPHEGEYYPIYYAAQFGSGELVTLFIENGAFLDRVKPLFNAWSNPQAVPQRNTITPLHLAAKHGNYEAVIKLVNGGAKLNGNWIQHNGNSSWQQEGTPLDFAVANLTYKDNPKNLELVKFLIDNGARMSNAGAPIICPVIKGYLNRG